MGAKCKYTEAQLRKFVKTNTTISGVIRDLGIRWSGGMHSHIKHRIVEAGIDISHFVGKAHGGGGKVKRKHWKEYLILYRSGYRKLRSPILKRALFQSGIEEKCSGCDIGNTWRGEKLVLDIDHVNGNHLDNRRSNLRFLCPNCHRQTETYGVKKSK